MSGRASNKQIAAAVIGNALEWYDFIVYGYLAVTISKLFFPPGSETTALLATFALFGVAFFMRPVGGILLGHFTDVIGRKSILFLVIALMTLGIGMIAFTPTYATIGVAAPIIMLIARLIQGLSAGGEFASSTSFLVEHAPPGRRGLYGGWQMSGQGAAAFLAGLVGLLLAATLTPAEVEAWGWRVPFLAGLIIGPLGFFIRLGLVETPEFLSERAKGRPAKAPLGRALANHKTDILIGLGLVVGGTASIYVLIIFMPTYAIRTLKLSPQAAYIAPLAAGLVQAVLTPVMGRLSDRLGRKPVMATSIVLTLLALYPEFLWLNDAPSLIRLAAISVIGSALISGHAGAVSTALVELFPVSVRATGSAIAYNLGVTLFGGFAPFIVAWLIARTGDPFAPAYYVMAGLALSLVAVIFMPGRQARGVAAPLRA
jgi:MHS family proline/betaine transporter-like MFS transporter